MVISTKGRYGLRAMFVLAQNEQPVSVKYISEIQSISATYLEQLLRTLREAGLVRSLRGAYGGYTLARTPEEISVGDVLVALEGPLVPADCVLDHCDNSHMCATHAIWCRIYDGFSKVVDAITLKDMLDDYNAQRTALEADDYVRCK